MKKSDLHREWARVLDMCEGANVDPRACWKYEKHLMDCVPELTSLPDDYEFAVAILEGKPVFAEDKVWLKNGGGSGIVTKEWTNISDDIYSWNPPKTTFKLNGEELPCPDKSNRFELKIVGFVENNYHFNNATDIRQVECAINRLLQDATK